MPLMDAMTIELVHSRNPGTVITSVKGWIEGRPEDIRQLSLSDSVQFSDLDPRLEGNVAILRFNSNRTRFELTVNSGPIKVEGRELKVGERVCVETGGKILWNP